ncbi:hypothetical protein HOD20_00380 [archaeon]|jgi:hypothetical protein|nr:hypothetical protein [archaeon]MBT4646893.1 hypothetical protein [archaeon]MBT6822138.1 hypothetical protein [archaeon]MBT7392981.1 hypothetical protein [archaeon]
MKSKNNFYTNKNSPFNNKKGSIFMTILVIAVAIALFLLTNAKPTPDTGQRILMTEQYSEMTSTMMYESVEIALSQVTRDFGEYAIKKINNGYWTSYSQPTPPEFSDVKDLLEEDIKNTLIDYLYQLDGSEVGDIKIDSNIDIKEVVIEIPTEEDLMSGEFDEGFSATVKADGQIELQESDDEGEKPERSYQEMSFNVPIGDWRFWYLYRNIKSWALENKFGNDVCNEMPQYGIRGSGQCKYKSVTAEGDENPALEKLKDAVANLQARFDVLDDNVTCSYQMLCGGEEAHVRTEIYPESAPCGDSYSAITGKTCPGECAAPSCEYANNVQDCEIKCSEPDACVDALDESERPTCTDGEIEYVLGEYGEGKPYPTYPTDPLTINTPCFGAGSEHFWSQIAEIKCVDDKNTRPIGENAPVPLEFKFKVHLHFYRFHEAYKNSCEPNNVCMKGPKVSGGSNNDNSGGGDGGTSTPTPPKP